MQISNKKGMKYVKVNPYRNCPIYESKSFIIRLVEEVDAGDLLECYSDPKSVKLMNSDFCTSDFYYTTLDEMQKCIHFWLDEYSRGSYVRFAIVDKLNKKAIGTIEMFDGEAIDGKSGV